MEINTVFAGTVRPEVADEVSAVVEGIAAGMRAFDGCSGDIEITTYTDNKGQEVIDFYARINRAEGEEPFVYVKASIHHYMAYSLSCEVHTGWAAVMEGVSADVCVSNVDAERVGACIKILHQR